MASPQKKIWITIILILLIVAGVGIYKFYKSKFLDDTLPDTVRTESRGLYRISYDTIMVDEVLGSLVVHNVKIQVDTAYLNADTSNKKGPSVLINLHADTLRVLGVQTPRALLTKEIKGRKLLIKNASVELLRLNKTRNKAEDTVKADLLEQIYFDVIKELGMVSMDTIMLENIDLTYKDFKTRKLILRGANISLNLFDLLIDETTPVDRDRIFFSRKVQIFADSIQMRDTKGHYDFIFNRFLVNTASKELSLKSVVIKPLLGEAAFVRSLKTQKDRFDIALSSIFIKGIDPSRLAIGEISADSLTVNKSSFLIFRDLRIPRDKVNRVGQYPHQVVMDIPFPVNIKQAFFYNSFIEYKEINEKTNKPGRVQFNRVSAVMNNITNERQAMRRNNFLTIRFNALFLNMAKADVVMKLRLGDEQGRFSVKGELGPFDARQLNKITEPMALTRIERGTVQSIVFDMQGDNYKSDGELTMLYDKLKVTSLKLEEDKSGYKKKGLASLVANIIVKNKNPSGGVTRIARMKTDRNTNRSFFNLIWRSIFQGVKEKVGMDKIGKKK